MQSGGAIIWPEAAMVHFDVFMLRHDRRKAVTSGPLIRQRPLRTAGQSLEEGITELRVARKALAVIGIFVTLILLLSWWDFARPPTAIGLFRKAIFLSIFFVAYGGFLAVVHRRLGIMQRNKELGRAGELIVGQALDALRADGYHVFHDVRADYGNIDHVVAGPGGIFAVETKMRSKRQGDRIIFEGSNLFLGKHSNQEAVDQVKMQSDWLRRRLAKSTSHDFPVHPILVYPGWYIEDGFRHDLWVLNENSIVTTLRKRQASLAHEDVALVADRLELYARDSNSPRLNK